MLRLNGLLWAGVVLALGIAPAAAACMSDQSKTQVAEGKLVVASKRDAAGRQEKPYIITLTTPACLTAQDPEDNVKSTRTIHIYSTQEKVHSQIGKLVGKTVQVRGVPFAAHTAHHHAPIVMDISEIGPR
jgi:hypothetical protein